MHLDNSPAIALAQRFISILKEEGKIKNFKKALESDSNRMNLIMMTRRKIPENSREFPDTILKNF